ncbi:MAG: hypothetical protein M1832_003792 [Thelocarpon impressellum]|nr:MAG: hypothetical protein M1832_003792 [Thelocarpon impressellum]
MAWISLCLIGVTSISFVRRRWFEAFYYPHALFLLFVIGALIHATHAAEFIVPGLALWGVDRLIRFGYNFRHIEIISATQHPGDLTKLKIRGLRTHHPTQIAWIQIPGASLLDWHPFTVASAPSAEKEAVFAVRGLGGYTKRVQHLAAAARRPQGVGETELASPASSNPMLLKMRVDGPYGVGHIQWGVHPVTVLVAGGIGITPGISIASHIIERARRPDVRTAGREWHVHILWMVKLPQHVAWFDEDLAHLAAIGADPSVPVSLSLEIYVTSDGTGESEAIESAYEMHSSSQHRKYLASQNLVHHGHPDMPAYFRGLRNQYPGLDVVVSVCGPRRLIDAVRTEAVAGQKGGKNVGAYHVEAEVFEI